MGQVEVLNALKNQDKPLSRREISEMLGEDLTKISHILNALLKFGDVHYIEIDRHKAKEMFGEKAPPRRMKLYYIK